ncbi:MAG: LPXTG-site transpeptidase (sortase) family protein [Candidatus Aldehydirespiratoraceae bacterium]|jgi:LPXTG-site transpeptidase (sortase) family protein
MNTMRIAAGALALAILVGSCAGGGAASEGPASTTTEAQSTVVGAPESTTTAPPPITSASGFTSRLETSPLAELVQPAGNLLFDPLAVTSAPQPISVDIESIGVAAAGVRDVGVQANGEMEVPAASEVGWYRWSPSPGREGSAVLAAHIAYNGTDGVFRNLDDVDVGALVTIGYDDGSVRDFEIVEMSQYPKDELPFDQIFAKDGDPVVALITCGGTFNPTLRSYDDNVVAYAVPI